MASAHHQERREARYEVPIEVEISGLDRTGQVFRERTFTKDVSEWGCGFIVVGGIKVDDIVAVSLVAPGVPEELPRGRRRFSRWCECRGKRVAGSWGLGK